MAKTEFEIYMDFQKVQLQIEELRNIASRMSSLADDDISGTISSIRGNWSGENADAFTAKGIKIQEKIGMTANDIRKAADTFETMAIRMRDAELANIRIAKE